MRAKGDVGIISNIISTAIRIHKDDYCDDHLSNESVSLRIYPSQDDVEHGYYDEDDDSDFDLDESMIHFGLMANLRGYMAGEKDWVLYSGCTDHMTGDNSKGKVAISHDSSIQNVMLVESLGYNLLSVSVLADFGFNVLLIEVDCQVLS